MSQTWIVRLIYLLTVLPLMILLLATLAGFDGPEITTDAEVPKVAKEAEQTAENFSANHPAKLSDTLSNELKI